MIAILYILLRNTEYSNLLTHNITSDNVSLLDGYLKLCQRQCPFVNYLFYYLVPCEVETTGAVYLFEQEGPSCMSGEKPSSIPSAVSLEEPIIGGVVPYNLLLIVC